MTKRNFKQSAPEGTHYFASSVAEWRTGSSLGDIATTRQEKGASAETQTCTYLGLLTGRHR